MYSLHDIDNRLPMAERVGCGTPCLLGSLGVREVVGLWRSREYNHLWVPLDIMGPVGKPPTLPAHRLGAQTGRVGSGQPAPANRAPKPVYWLIDSRS